MLLRSGGIDAPIYILGECPPEAAEYAVEKGMILTVNTVASARAFSEIAKKGT